MAWKEGGKEEMKEGRKEERKEEGKKKERKRKDEGKMSFARFGGWGGGALVQEHTHIYIIDLREATRKVEIVWEKQVPKGPAKELAE